MIDYKKTCKWELARYYEKLMAIDSLQDEIDTLTTRMEGIRSPTMDATPVQGGGSTAEERIINAICNRDNLTVASAADGPWPVYPDRPAAQDT